jgi:dethiobiotin synthetase
MTPDRLPGIFVTGTDTGVGKTRIASQLAARWTAEGRRVAVLKSVATGAVWKDGRLLGEDTECLASAVGGEPPLERVTPLVFEPPLAPSVAARVGGEPLTFDRVGAEVREALAWWVRERGVEVAVVEGVGGLLCPLAEGATVADLAVWLDYPLLIVARNALGVLNHTLLTVEAALIRSLRVAGVVLNRCEPGEPSDAVRTNAEELSRRLPTGVPLLADLAFGESLALPGDARSVDWYGRAQPPRETPPSRAVSAGQT